MGAYNQAALAITLGNLLRPKGTAPEKYLEAPFSEMKRMQDINAGLIEMSEEEKEYWRGKLMNNLEDMQKQFEQAHK